MNINKQKDILIGLARVSTTREASSIFNGASGAYVNVLCYASNEAEFLHEVKNALQEMHLKLEEIEDIEHVSERLKDYEIEEYLLQLIPKLNEQDRVKLGTFHTYV